MFCFFGNNVIMVIIGIKIISKILIKFTGIKRTNLEPIVEPNNAKTTDIIPIIQFIFLDIANLRVANKVPKDEENLFVPKTICPGRPKKR